MISPLHPPDASEQYIGTGALLPVASNGVVPKTTAAGIAAVGTTGLASYCAARSIVRIPLVESCSCTWREPATVQPIRWSTSARTTVYWLFVSPLMSWPSRHQM